MLWEIDIHPAAGEPDRSAARIAAAARELGLVDGLCVGAARGFLIQGVSIDRDQVERLANQLLADLVVERHVFGQVGEPCLIQPPAIFVGGDGAQCVTVLLKPGVMDPVAQSTLAAAADLGVAAEAVMTLRKYWFAGADETTIRAVSTR